MLRKIVVLASAFLVVGCVSTPPSGGHRSLNNTPWGYQRILDPTGSAPTQYVERFEVRAGDCSSGATWSDCSNDRERSEISTPKNNILGNEYRYTWSIYIPEDYESAWPAKVTLGQFHQLGDNTVGRLGKHSWGTTPPFMFVMSENGLLIVNNNTISPSEVVVEKDNIKGKWHTISVEAKWDKKNGYFNVYADGERKYAYDGKTTENTVYFKYGIYRRSVSYYQREHGKEIPTQVVYFTGFTRSPINEY